MDKDTKAMRELCQTDLFFLLYIGLKRVDMDKDWIYGQCREFEANPEGHIDLWFREGFKSSICNIGGNIQEVLRNPEETISIFSHTRPIAKGFLAQIKREFESNTFLQDLFPDILYKNPEKESPRWSLDDGIIVKRKTNPKESTIEAWGLIDGQPTSKHFGIINYDDVVVRESVTTPDMIAKTTEAWATSLNLGKTEGGRIRYQGTRWHANDTYKTIMDRGAAIPRIRPATDNGTFSGKPVLWTQEQFDRKVREMGSYVAAAQLLLNPLADNVQGFKLDWLSWYHNLANYNNWNFYILVDPANAKKKENDYTVIAVVGLAPDKNYYLVDAVRDRMNLTERTRKVMEFHRKWTPLNTGYEQYGMQADIEHIRYVQEQEGYRFLITELGGSTPKVDRIRKLVPIFENHRFYMPRSLLFVTVDRKVKDFIQEFLRDEYESFPLGTHDDMLDCLARVMDEQLMAKFPKVSERLPIGLPKAQTYNPLNLVTKVI